MNTGTDRHAMIAFLLDLRSVSAKGNLTQQNLLSEINEAAQTAVEAEDRLQKLRSKVGYLNKEISGVMIEAGLTDISPPTDEEVGSYLLYLLDRAKQFIRGPRKD
jgi:hypothetical protein